MTPSVKSSAAKAGKPIVTVRAKSAWIIEGMDIKNRSPMVCPISGLFYGYL